MSFGASQYDAPLGANQSVGVMGSQSQWEEPRLPNHADLASDLTLTPDWLHDLRQVT